MWCTKSKAFLTKKLQDKGVGKVVVHYSGIIFYEAPESLIDEIEEVISLLFMRIVHAVSPPTNLTETQIQEKIDKLDYDATKKKNVVFTKLIKKDVEASPKDSGARENSVVFSGKESKLLQLLVNEIERSSKASVIPDSIGASNVRKEPPASNGDKNKESASIGFTSDHLNKGEEEKRDTVKTGAGIKESVKRSAETDNPVSKDPFTVLCRVV